MDLRVTAPRKIIQDKVLFHKFIKSCTKLRGESSTFVPNVSLFECIYEPKKPNVITEYMNRVNTAWVQEFINITIDNYNDKATPYVAAWCSENTFILYKTMYLNREADKDRLEKLLESNGLSKATIRDAMKHHWEKMLENINTYFKTDEDIPVKQNLYAIKTNCRKLDCAAIELSVIDLEKAFVCDISTKGCASTPKSVQTSPFPKETSSPTSLNDQLSLGIQRDIRDNSDNVKSLSLEPSSKSVTESSVAHGAESAVAPVAESLASTPPSSSAPIDEQLQFYADIIYPRIKKKKELDNIKKMRKSLRLTKLKNMYELIEQNSGHKF